LVADVARALELVTRSRDYLVSQNQNRKPEWLPIG